MRITRQLRGLPPRARDHAHASIWPLALAWFFATPPLLHAEGSSFQTNDSGSRITYTNHHVIEVPWSIHVVRVERSNPQIQIHSAHAGGGAVGLATLSDQIQRMDPSLGSPAAGINGDFYQRDRDFAGDPRGLQVIDGEVISAPNGGASFWIDVLGQPHASNVSSLFQIAWPNGATNSFGLNEERGPDELVLYTRAAGTSTHTSGGRELILEPAGEGQWLPLKMGKTYQARIREIREGGDTRLAPGVLVLSVGPALAGSLPNVTGGSVLTVSTASSPNLRGAKTAIGGGPLLVRNGKRQKTSRAAIESYEFSSMAERHPRTAVGWNQTHFFLIEVDGRQKNLSAGMTLDELSTYLTRLGCEDAINLDGGGSATLWYDGKVRNSPCDGQERPIANSLVVVSKSSTSPPRSSGTVNSPR